MERIVSVLQELEQADIPYCLLRNYQFLLGGDIGSDIDLALREENREKTANVLSEAGFYKKAGHSKRKHSIYKGYLGNGTIAKLDISWGGSEYNGLPTVDIDRLLSNRRRLNGCWIPSDEDYFVQIVFHGAIKKNGYRDSYRQDLENLRQTVDSKAVRRHATDLFGHVGRTTVDHALDGNFDRIPELKWKLVASNCLQRPQVVAEFAYILCYENNIRNRLKRIWKRIAPSPTPILIVTGPDGAGKSTLTETAASEFEAMGYDVHRAKLGLTNDSAIVMDVATSLYNRFTEYDVEEVKELESRGEKTLDERDGFHKAVVHYIDIFLRYAAAKRSEADIIIADRFIHDVDIYDQAGPLRETFGLFESETVYPFLLTGEPEILAERSEYTLESLAELVERYETLEFERLDATNEPDEVLKGLLERSLVEEDVLKHL